MSEETNLTPDPADYVETVVETPVVDAANEDAVLLRTQEIRMRLAETLAADQYIDQDAKRANVLIKLLDGADKQVTSLRKIRNGERANDINAGLAQALDQYVGKMGSGVTRHDGSEPVETNHRPVVPNLPTFQMKAGELDPVGKSIDVEGIISEAIEKFRPKAQE